MWILFALVYGLVASFTGAYLTFSEETPSFRHRVITAILLFTGGGLLIPTASFIGVVVGVLASATAQ